MPDSCCTQPSPSWLLESKPSAATNTSRSTSAPAPGEVTAGRASARATGRDLIEYLRQLLQPRTRRNPARTETRARGAAETRQRRVAAAQRASSSTPNTLCALRHAVADRLLLPPAPLKLDASHLLRRAPHACAASLQRSCCPVPDSPLSALHLPLACSSTRLRKTTNRNQ